MNTISQSVLSTNYVQVPVTIRSPSPYDPTGNVVQFSFTPLTYPETSPTVWSTGTWQAFPGPAYWAQVLVGPGGVSLALGTWMGWVKVSDSPATPVGQPFILVITP